MSPSGVARVPRKRLSIYPTFSTWMIFQDNKIVDEAIVGKCQKNNRIRKSFFATPEVMDLGQDHQCC